MCLDGIKNAICRLCKAQPHEPQYIPQQALPTDPQQGCGGYEHLLSNTNKRGKKTHVTFNMFRGHACRRALVSVTARSPWPP